MSAVSRRHALGAAVAAVLPAKAAPRAVTIGMATTEFRRHTNSALAKVLSAEGLHTIQLFLTQSDSNYWKNGVRSDLAGLTRERSAEIAGIYRAAGLRIHSIGVYINMMHPDEAERKASIAYFEAMMRVGDAMAVRAFITETGQYRPESPAPGVPYERQEEVWRTMVATGKELARVAEAHDATVLIEPGGSFLSSAKRARLYLEAVGSSRIRALLDPANLLEANDVEEMFNQLQPWIDCFHVKDRKLHPTTRAAVAVAGEGDLDYRKLVAMAAERTPAAPLILEYVGDRANERVRDFRQALAHLRRVVREEGLVER